MRFWLSQGYDAALRRIVVSISANPGRPRRLTSFFLISFCSAASSRVASFLIAWKSRYLMSPRALSTSVRTLAYCTSAFVNFSR